MELVFLFGLMAFFFALGVPIGIALIFPSFILLLVDPVTSASFLSQNFYTGVASSTMIAIPFFMICGNIMDRGGISRRLVNAANNCIGNVTGSLGAVTILACMFFGVVPAILVGALLMIVNYLCCRKHGIKGENKTLEKWDLPYVRSNANFMFFDILTDSKAVVEALEKKGILIRSGYDYGFPTMLRISIGTPEENRIVLGELGRILGKEI